MRLVKYNVLRQLETESLGIVDGCGIFLHEDGRHHVLDSEGYYLTDPCEKFRILRKWYGSEEHCQGTKGK